MTTDVFTHKRFSISAKEANTIRWLQQVAKWGEEIGSNSTTVFKHDMDKLIGIKFIGEDKINDKTVKVFNKVLNRFIDVVNGRVSTNDDWKLVTEADKILKELLGK